MTIDHRQSILSADAQLSRFEPLQRILFYDDFNQGLQGWTSLIGNYEHSLDAMLPAYKDMRPPMLSNLTMWDSGTVGTLTGNYALKLATRPRTGSISFALKRTTFRVAAPIRLETFFTFKPEATKPRLGESDVRTVGVLFDLQDSDRKTDNPQRIMPHIRYLNALDGKPVGCWQYKEDREPLHDIGDSGQTVSHFHLAAEGWKDLPDGEQSLCYNEIATKHNWYYLRLDFDLASMSYLRFQCNDRVFDVSDIGPMRMPAMPNLSCMLNSSFWIESDCNNRAFLYLDSVMLSTISGA
jgi:hypothetical protein